LSITVTALYKLDVVVDRSSPWIGGSSPAGSTNVHPHFSVLCLPLNGSISHLATHTVCRKDPVFRNNCLLLDRLPRLRFSWFSAILPEDCRCVTERPRQLSSRIVLINKFWEELICYLPLIRRGSHRKRRIQQSFYCCVCIRCRGKIFNQPLPRNSRGITHTDTDSMEIS
jgi:hypothetical protein